MTIDPLTLFLRLLVAVERKPEDEITNYFNYELRPYPMSLFKDGKTRPSNKSKLKTFLMKDTKQIDASPETTEIFDGGALLWCCNWKKYALFEYIFEKYSRFLSYHNFDIVVFDGYAPSTKDATHRKRAGAVCERVEIQNENPCTADRTTFFSNYKNKENFVETFAEKLRAGRFNVVQCPMDANTKTVKTALTVAQDSSVTVFSDYTDIITLLVYHVIISVGFQHIYLTNATGKKEQQRRECYSVTEVLNGQNRHVIKYLLFSHAFSGCKTISAIDNFGKTSNFKKLQDSKGLTDIAEPY